MEDLNKDIIRYNDILGNFELLKQVVLDELEETKKKYGDERRTELSNAIFSEDDEDLVPNEEILIMLTESGYIKRVNPDEFKVQNRGGIGVIGMETKEDDVVSEMIHARTKVDILFFTNFGKVYRVRGYQIPEGTRTSKGVPAVNIVKLENGEKILTILPAEKYDEQHYFFFTTVNGVVKRTRSDEFENINSNGKIAIGLKEGDSLVDVKYTDGTALISLASSKGKVCTFHEDDVRSMGRTATGVRGMNLDGGKVVGVCTDKGGNDILTLSANGYGKRSDYSEFRITNRGSKGVKALNVSEKSGDLVMIKAVKADEKIVIITDGGTTMKTEINDIHEAGRATLGVKVITLKEGENISSVSIELSDAEFQELANEKTIAESGDSEGAVSEKSVENYVNGTGRNDDDSSEDDSGSSDKSDE
jgi:DNA gyrase subunit A